MTFTMESRFPLLFIVEDSADTYLRFRRQFIGLEKS